jgi:enterochelin esterase-like enzyme
MMQELTTARIFKRIIAGFLCICILNFAYSQNEGKILENKSISSSVLKRDVKYSIYLPPDYSTSERYYPVVYLFHGFSDDQTGWTQFGEIKYYADKGTAEGVIPSMIIIMPKENYEDFFVKEFIPSVEKSFRIKSEKRYRGIAGLSMGGYGSLYFSIKYPELFVAAAPLSAGVFEDNEIVTMPDQDWESLYGPIFGSGLKGRQRLNKAWYNFSILKLVETKRLEDLNKVRYWIDCGDDDFLTKGNCLLHIALTEKKVPHEFRVRNGAHSWSYWRTGITDALHFIGQSFRQE